MPKDFDTNALWYNKEIFDKCGVPYPTDDMSYDDLVATAKALKDSGKLGDGVYPFACPVEFQTWYYQTVYANGGYILSDDKKSTGYDDPKTQVFSAGSICTMKDYLQVHQLFQRQQQMRCSRVDSLQ